ncbi:transposase [Nostoc sp.]|uniref:transposase n=1 Tax=Nostoc sp. TaxID=1180 RepID=UPI003FA52EF1
MPYSSSLTDKEWEIIEPLLPQKKKTRHPLWTKRQILNGMVYQLKNSCNWGDLRKIYPPTPPYSGTTSSGSHNKCQSKSGMLYTLRFENKSKKPKWTTLLLIDSQAVKNTCNVGVESKGFCFYKSTNGIKRHLAVDSLGLPLSTDCSFIQRVG